MKLFWIVCALAGLFIQVAGAQQYVNASVSPKPVVCKPGDSTRVAIRLSIRDGWHIMSASTSRENSIPTSAKLTPPKEITYARLDYPEGVKRKFPFATDPLEIYENECVLMLTVATDARARGGKYTIPVEIRYQACSSTACVMPASVKVDVVVLLPYAKSSGAQTPRRGRKLRWFEDSRLFE